MKDYRRNRGTGWEDKPYNVPHAEVFADEATLNDENVGFRLVRDVETAFAVPDRRVDDKHREREGGLGHRVSPQQRTEEREQ